MAFNNQHNNYAAGMIANDFILFPGSSRRTSYDGDFDTDIREIEKASKVDDSGYFSNANFDYLSEESVMEEEYEPFSWCQHGSRIIYSTDYAASTTANNGSVCDGQESEGTATTVQAAASYHHQQSANVNHRNKSNKSKSGRSRMDNTRSSRKHSKPHDKVTVPGPLHTWVSTEESHESRAYRLSHPAKQRKTTERRQ